MSADIWLLDEAGNQIVIDDDADAELRSMVPIRSAGGVDSTTFNLTYNLTPMLRAAGMPAWSEFIDMPAFDAGIIWYRTAMNLRSAEATMRALEPESGWGTYEGAVEVITALANACLRFPKARVGGWL